MHSEHDWTECYQCLKRDALLLREVVEEIYSLCDREGEDVNGLYIAGITSRVLDKTHGQD